MTWRTRLILVFAFALHATYAQESAPEATTRADAAQTLLQSIGALRTTYTADIELDTPDLAELKDKPVFSYKQRVCFAIIPIERFANVSVILGILFVIHD